MTICFLRTTAFAAALISIGAHAAAAPTALCPIGGDALIDLQEQIKGWPCGVGGACADQAGYEAALGYLIGRVMVDEVRKTSVAGDCLKRAATTLDLAFEGEKQTLLRAGFALGQDGKSPSEIPEWKGALPQAGTVFSALEKFVADSPKGPITAERLTGTWLMTAVTEADGSEGVAGSLWMFSADGTLAVTADGETMTARWRIDPGPDGLTTTVGDRDFPGRILSLTDRWLVVADDKGARAEFRRE